MATPGFDHSNAREDFAPLNTAKLRPSKKLRQRMRKKLLEEEAKKLQDNQFRKSPDEGLQDHSDISQLSPSGSSTIHPCLTMTNCDNNKQIQSNSNEEEETKQTLSLATLAEDLTLNNLPPNYETNGSDLNNYNTDEESSTSPYSSFEPLFTLNRIINEEDEMVEKKEGECPQQKIEKNEESLLELIRVEIAKNADHVVLNGILTFPKQAFFCSLNLTKLCLNRIFA